MLQVHCKAFSPWPSIINKSNDCEARQIARVSAHAYGHKQIECLCYKSDCEALSPWPNVISKLSVCAANQIVRL